MAFPKEPCPRCGHNIGIILLAILTGSRSEAYCSNCGLKVLTKCEKCGSVLTVKERYCSHCGTKNPIFFEKK